MAAVNNYTPQIKKSEFDAEISNIAATNSDVDVTMQVKYPKGMSLDLDYLTGMNGQSNNVLGHVGTGKNNVVFVNKDGKISFNLLLDINVSKEGEEGKAKIKSTTYYGDKLSIDIDGGSFNKENLIQYINGGVKIETIEDKIRLKDSKGNIKDYNIQKTPIEYAGKQDDKEFDVNSNMQKELLSEFSVDKTTGVEDMLIKIHKIKVEYEISDKDGKTTSKTKTIKFKKPSLIFQVYSIVKESSPYYLFSSPKGLNLRAIQSSYDTYTIKKVPILDPNKLPVDKIAAKNSVGKLAFK